jgi:hypothetical protein
MKRFRVTSETIMNNSFKHNQERNTSMLSPTRNMMDGPSEERKIGSIDKRKLT